MEKKQKNKKRKYKKIKKLHTDCTVALADEFSVRVHFSTTKARRAVAAPSAFKHLRCEYMARRRENIMKVLVFIEAT